MHAIAHGIVIDSSTKLSLPNNWPTKQLTIQSTCQPACQPTSQSSNQPTSIPLSSARTLTSHRDILTEWKQGLPWFLFLCLHVLTGIHVSSLLLYSTDLFWFTLVWLHPFSSSFETYFVLWLMMNWSLIWSFVLFFDHASQLVFFLYFAWAEFLNAEERLVREEFYRIEVEIEVQWPKKDTKEDSSPDSKPEADDTWQITNLY